MTDAQARKKAREVETRILFLVTPVQQVTTYAERGVEQEVFAVDTTTIVAIVVIAAIVLALLAVVMFFLRQRKSSDLQTRYGSEYDRAAKNGGRRKAESELSEREKRVSRYDIHALHPGQRDDFASRWTGVQAEFVDAPRTAVQHADVLLQEVMTARGYPLADFDQRAADLSVEHGDLVGNYRSAHDISRRAETASTEDLRRAMLQYRSMFEDLLKVEDTAAA